MAAVLTVAMTKAVGARSSTVGTCGCSLSRRLSVSVALEVGGAVPTVVV